jgi:uncharacterized membrane protein YkvA (DUF1232 family)
MNPLKKYQQLIENPSTRIIVVVLTLIYLFSPIDIVPDFIPIIGQIDDGVLVIMLISTLLRYAPKTMPNKAKKDSNVVDVESK